jgi:hypothetical protein
MFFGVLRILFLIILLDGLEWEQLASSNLLTDSVVGSSPLIPPQAQLFTVAPLDVISTDQLTDNLKSLLFYGGCQENQFYRFDLEKVLHVGFAAMDPSPPNSADHSVVTRSARTRVSAMFGF